MAARIVPAFAFIIALIALGHLLGRRRVLPERAADTLNLVVLYVNLPAAVLLYASKLAWSPQLLGLVAVPWLLLAASALAVLALARLARWPREVVAVLLLTVPLGNTSYLGYPLTEALLGPAALPYAVVYDQFGSFVILSTYGLVVLALYGRGARPRLGEIARRILAFPAFIALVLALTVVPAELPAPLAAMLKRLADMLMPMVALAIGLQLKLKPERAHLAPLGAGLALKLLAVPALALGLCALFGLHGDLRAAAVLESAMASMITAAALASMAGLAPELAAAMVGYGIVLMAATLPLWLALLR